MNPRPPANNEGTNNSPAVPFDPLAELTAWQTQNHLEGKVKSLSDQLERARHYFDAQDFEQPVGAGEKLLREAQLSVPDGFVKNALIAEATQNHELRNAFDNRGSDPQAFSRALKKAHNRIFESARRMPDPEATGDKLAVLQAMRSATTYMPKEKPPNYGSMTDAEFAKEKAKFGL